MSDAKPVGIDDAEIFDEGSRKRGDFVAGGSIVLRFSRPLEDKECECLVNAEALYLFCQDCAKWRGTGDREMLTVLPEDLDDGEDDNDGAGVPLSEPEKIIDAEIVEKKPEE